MRLYEYEGKRLLAEYGASVPNGALWPDKAADLSYPVAVKAQLIEGGRGKRGGIRFASDANAAEQAAEALLAGSAALPPAHAVLLEQKVEVRHEFYLALLMDREYQAPLLLASQQGGVEIESVADEHMLRLPINLMIGIPDYVVRQVANTLALPRQNEQDLKALLSGMWSLFVDEDCLLVEINPLVLTMSGALMAVDARLVVDDNARWRHADWAQPREGTLFERRCAELGATATEMDGSVAIVTSGAGLGMATVDLMTALGGNPRCFVDLGGSVFGGSHILAQIVEAVRDLRPRSILFNYFFQFARADILAAGIAASFHRRSPECPVVIRMRGFYAEEAREMLASFNFFITDDMLTACRVAATAHGVEVNDGEHQG